MNSSKKKEIAGAVVVAVFALFLLSATITTSDAHASSSSSKITVRYTEVGQYFGTGNIVIKNLDTKKTIVSEKLNFQKQHDSQGKNCCVKTYDFSNKGNHNGDRLFVKVTANGGSWSQSVNLHLGSMKITVSMDEVWCGVHGDECD
jgi:hypothetical protein